MPYSGGLWGEATNDVRSAMGSYLQQSPDYDSTIQYLKNALSKRPDLSDKIKLEMEMVENEHAAVRARSGDASNVRPDQVFKQIDSRKEAGRASGFAESMLENSPSSFILEKLGVPEKIDIGVPARADIPSTILLDILSNRKVLGPSLDVLAGAAVGGAAGAAGRFLGASLKGKQAGSIAKKAIDLQQKLSQQQQQLETLKTFKPVMRKVPSFSDFM